MARRAQEGALESAGTDQCLARARHLTTTIPRGDGCAVVIFRRRTRENRCQPESRSGRAKSMSHVPRARIYVPHLPADDAWRRGGGRGRICYQFVAGVVSAWGICGACQWPCPSIPRPLSGVLRPGAEPKSLVFNPSGTLFLTNPRLIIGPYAGTDTARTRTWGALRGPVGSLGRDPLYLGSRPSSMTVLGLSDQDLVQSSPTDAG